MVILLQMSVIVLIMDESGFRTFNLTGQSYFFRNKFPCDILVGAGAGAAAELLLILMHNAQLCPHHLHCGGVQECFNHHWIPHFWWNCVRSSECCRNYFEHSWWCDICICQVPRPQDKEEKHISWRRWHTTCRMGTKRKN
ncbi:hypothetical protein Hamer_G017157 [Homarus americanus]|uniref:Uncharacterized protein n=1 Tax=Homarus americanus TaxID=6706 RepID=A0A8J5K090_HOMAM|nr:hypothetical protein Hamer_G017157 [Homarus americanus]